MTNPIRIAIIGTAKRSSYLYGPLLKAIPGIELVSVWGRSAEKAKTLAENFGVPAYTDLDKLVRETAPHIGIVDVAYSANGEVGLMALAGVLLWKEKVGTRGWFGIALAVIALVLIQIGKAA